MVGLTYKLWPTPRAVDGEVRHSWPWVQKRVAERRDVDLTTMVRHVGDVRSCTPLNPDWVECLMGLPAGWTSEECD